MNSIYWIKTGNTRSRATKQTDGFEYATSLQLSKLVKAPRHDSTYVGKESRMNRRVERNHISAFNRGSHYIKVASCLKRRQCTVTRTEELNKSGVQGFQECSGGGGETPHGLVTEQRCEIPVFQKESLSLRKHSITPINSVWSVTV